MQRMNVVLPEPDGPHDDDDLAPLDGHRDALEHLVVGRTNLWTSVASTTLAVSAGGAPPIASRMVVADGSAISDSAHHGSVPAVVAQPDQPRRAGPDRLVAPPGVPSASRRSIQRLDDAPDRGQQQVPDGGGEEELERREVVALLDARSDVQLDDAQDDSSDVVLSMLLNSLPSGGMITRAAWGRTIRRIALP